MILDGHELSQSAFQNIESFFGGVMVSEVEPALDRPRDETTY